MKRPSVLFRVDAKLIAEHLPDKRIGRSRGRVFFKRRDPFEPSREFRRQADVAQTKVYIIGEFLEQLPQSRSYSEAIRIVCRDNPAGRESEAVVRILLLQSLERCPGLGTIVDLEVRFDFVQQIVDHGFKKRLIGSFEQLSRFLGYECEDSRTACLLIFSQFVSEKFA